MVEISVSEINQIYGKEFEFADKLQNEININIQPLKIIQKHKLSFDGNKLKLSDIDFEFYGNSIKKHLKNCDHCYMMIATLGFNIDKLIDKYQISDMTSSYIADKAANILIEKYCDQITQEIRESEKINGFEITTRFSPGYGDFPLETQKEFLKIINAEKLGVYLTDGYLMKPFKTVTAVIGVGNIGKTDSDRCGNCKNRNNCERQVCDDKY